MSLSTPTKVAASIPTAESPGNWRHPRLSEVSKRKIASDFGERNIHRIAYNVAALALLWGLALLLRQYTPAPKWFSPSFKWYAKYAYLVMQAFPLVNIALASMPLLRKSDDCSDIPLTPSQRKLLGLPASSLAASPDAVFSTPPRYSRTPSISGSVSSRNAVSGSPLSGRASPVPLMSPSPASPLLQKAVNGTIPRRSSFSSPSPLGVSTSSSLFPESPSPSPVGMGKRSSVGLNNKWLYDRGRRASGQNWYT